ncbi:MAG TPA: AI-2E family transporter [Leifsonia sp.]|jgi:predicted PurR-regulated permease PerM|nr:AI-2E family transporter [Leifsonia sp.]
MTQLVEHVDTPPADGPLKASGAPGDGATVPVATAVTPSSAPPVAALAAIGRHPLRWGYLLSLGAIGGVVTGLLVLNLRTVVFSIFMAAFITVGLDPLLRWLQRRGMSRGSALIAVIALITALLVLVLWIVIPVVVTQVSDLIAYLPTKISELRSAGWFDGTNKASNGVLGSFLAWIAQQVKNPAVLTAVGQGTIGFGIGLLNALSTGVFITILTIYFVASYDHAKETVFSLVSRSHRATFESYANRILENVGKYLSGMVVLAFMNAVFSTVLLLIAGVPGAFLIGMLAFFITMIPLIGTVLTTIGMTIISFLHSPISALVVLIAMLVYMQVEAYVLTPKVMSKAVKVPGSIVLISALAGATLFGLPGALTAIPFSAAIILLVKEIVIPAKELT